MEWFLENPEGMLGMRHFMKRFEEEHKYGVVKLVVDYCAWNHYYMKPTDILKAMPTGHSRYIPRSFVLLTNQTVQKQDSRNCIAIAALQNSDLYAGLT